MFSRLTINQLRTLALYRWSAMRSTSLSFLATDRQGLFVMDGFFDTLLPAHWTSKTLLAAGSCKVLYFFSVFSL